MTKRKNKCLTLLSEKTDGGHGRRSNLGALLFSKYHDAPGNKDDSSSNNSNSSSSSSSPSRNYNFHHNNNNNINMPSSPNSSGSADSSPSRRSISTATSPYIKSPWIHLRQPPEDEINENSHSSLIGSLVREEGHVYSLAAIGDVLYTGSDGKNIRVWKDMKEYSGFKSSSGLVKAIVVWGEKIFTGHQDGKIRIWKFLGNKKKSCKRLGNLPTTKDYVKTAMNPKAYVEVGPKRNVPWLRHYDAVSCMSLDEENGLLYSGSWDKTVKVWRLSDSKCIESINAHDDAVNSVAVGFDGLVFTGSADGTVKAWRSEETVGASTNHVLVDTLLRQDNAVTSLAVSVTASAVYAGSSDGLVNFWERRENNGTYSVVYGGVLRGHKLAVLCVAAAGNLVLSGSADKNICVWRRDDGGIHTCVSVLTGHSGPVKCLAVVEDRGRDNDDEEDDDDDCHGQPVKNGDQRWRVYSGSLDKSVKIWRLSEHSPEY